MCEGLGGHAPSRQASGLFFFFISSSIDSRLYKVRCPTRPFHACSRLFDHLPAGMCSAAILIGLTILGSSVAFTAISSIGGFAPFMLALPFPT